MSEEIVDCAYLISFLRMYSRRSQGHLRLQKDLTKSSALSEGFCLQNLKLILIFQDTDDHNILGRPHSMNMNISVIHKKID